MFGLGFWALIAFGGLIIAGAFFATRLIGWENKLLTRFADFLKDYREQFEEGERASSPCEQCLMEGELNVTVQRVIQTRNHWQ